MSGARVLLTQRVEDYPDRGERRDALDQRWAGMLGEAGFTPLLLANRLPDVVGYLDTVEPDLIVLTGGNDLAGLPGARNAAPERDATEAAAIDWCVEHRSPVLAVCRGLQHLIAHLGGELIPLDGHVAVPHTVSVVNESVWPIRDGREVNSFHDWGAEVAGVPEVLEVLARAPDGTVEAVAHRELPIVGIMWHPERPVEDRADLDLLAELAACGVGGQ